MKCVSYDGDADRFVYYFADEDKNLSVIDGDKMFSFFGVYIKGLLKELGIDD